MALPNAFDDKGQLRKYTTEELKALKGKNTKLPGYEAKLEDLKAGMLVKLVHAPNKSATSSRTADKEALKEAKELAAVSPKGVVTMIVILADGSNPTPVGNPKGKK